MYSFRFADYGELCSDTYRFNSCPFRFLRSLALCKQIPPMQSQWESGEIDGNKQSEGGRKRNNSLGGKFPRGFKAEDVGLATWPTDTDSAMETTRDLGSDQRSGATDNTTITARSLPPHKRPTTLCDCHQMPTPASLAIVLRLPKTALSWRPTHGVRKQGRLKTTWRTTFTEDLQAVDTTWDDAEEVAGNCDHWRTLVVLCAKRRRRL